MVPFGLVLILLSFFLNQFFLMKNRQEKIKRIEILLIFLTTIIYFLFIGNFPYKWQARYLYYIFPFYIIMIFDSFFLFLKKPRLFASRRFLILIFTAIFFIFMFSPYNVVKDLDRERTGIPNPFYGQQIYPEKALCSFLKENNISADQIIVARS